MIVLDRGQVAGVVHAASAGGAMSVVLGGLGALRGKALWQLDDSPWHVHW